MSGHVEINRIGYHLPRIYNSKSIHQNYYSTLFNVTLNDPSISYKIEDISFQLSRIFHHRPDLTLIHTREQIAKSIFSSPFVRFT